MLCIRARFAGCGSLLFRLAALGSADQIVFSHDLWKKWLTIKGKHEIRVWELDIMLQWREFSCTPAELSSWVASNLKTSFNYRQTRLSKLVFIRYYCDGYLISYEGLVVWRGTHDLQGGQICFVQSGHRGVAETGSTVWCNSRRVWS